MKNSIAASALVSVLLLPLLLVIPAPAFASTPVQTGGGTFDNTTTSFTVVASYGGYTFYTDTLTGVVTGSAPGTQNLNGFGVVLPSGGIVEQGTATGTFTVNGQTGTVTFNYNLYAANGVDFVGQLLGVGSGGLAGFQEDDVFQGAISPTGSTGTFQTLYQFGGSAAPAVERPLSAGIGSLTATDTQVGSPVTIGGYTFITYTSSSVVSGSTVGTSSGPQMLVIYPDGVTFAFAGLTTFTGTVGSSGPGSDVTGYVGQGDLTTGAYTANWGLASGTGGLAGIQGASSFMGSHGVAATYAGWSLLPSALGPGVNLQKADLQGLVLQGGRFAGDNLQHSSFANDNLGSASFAGANVQWADLSGTTLTGTASQNTIFDGANMQHASLENAVCGSPNYISAAGTNTQQADLTGSSGCSPPL